MSDELHKQLKIKAIMENTTIQDYVNHLIATAVGKENQNYKGEDAE
jgi:hypothetical protein